jgi:YD repeat-containing protein
LHAQPGINNDAFSYSFDYRNVLKGIPENASLGAYGNIPINTGSGLPDIQFNLYTVALDGVSVPISISYQASGVKFDDVHSSVGLKWSLNVGGSINRKVNGLIDEDDLINNLYRLDPSYINNINAHSTSHNNQTLFEEIAGGIRDFSADNYYYTLPGISDGMILTKTGNFYPDKQHSKVKIKKLNNHLDSFMIVDDKGVKYFFGAKYDYNSVQHNGKYYAQAFNAMAARVAWKLIKIITPHKDSIVFEYEEYEYSYQVIESQKFVKRNMGGGTGGPGFNNCGCGTNEYITNQPIYSNTVQLISKIKTKDVTVFFDYTTDTNLAAWKKKLSAIRVQSNHSGQQIKKIAFEHALFGNNKLKLSKYREYGSDNNVVKEYGFSYEAEIYSSFMDIGGRDIFGYNNGQGGLSLIGCPNAALYGYTGQIANRQVYDHVIANGTLNEIQYPTGGKTKFYYESNKETKGGYDYFVPGIRIKQIEDIDVDGKVYNKKIFYYAGLQNGVRMDWVLCAGENEYSPDAPDCPINSLNSESEIPGVFSTLYAYVVTESIGSGQKLYQKDYYIGASNLDATAYGLLTKTDYCVNDSVTVIRSTRTNYERIAIDTLKEYIYGLPRPIIFTGFYYYENDPAPYSFCAQNKYTMIAQNMLLVPAIYRKVQEVSKEFSTYNYTDSLVVKVDIAYDAVRNYVSKVVNTNSRTQVEEQRFTYNFNFPLNAILKDMTDSNIVTPVREEYYTAGNLNRIREMSFLKWYNSFFEIDQIKEAIGIGATLEQKFTYHQYDADGNILDMSKSQNIRQSYIYDYKKGLPIAEVINAQPVNIAYTSFEADGWGGWTMNPGSTILDNGNPLTGKKVFSGVILKTVPSGNYVVGVWGTADTWINGQLMTQPIKIRGLWKYYERVLNNVTNIEVAANIMDEVRLMPQGAQMTTYTYDPLIGMTSQCDVNNRITYYEYDAFGRLKTVRDENKNVLKTIDYQFQKNYNQ